MGGVRGGIAGAVASSIIFPIAYRTTNYYRTLPSPLKAFGSVPGATPPLQVDLQVTDARLIVPLLAQCRLRHRAVHGSSTSHNPVCDARADLSPFPSPPLPPSRFRPQIINAEHAGTAFEKAQWTGIGKIELDAEVARKKAALDAMSESEKRMKWIRCVQLLSPKSEREHNPT